MKTLYVAIHEFDGDTAVRGFTTDKTPEQIQAMCEHAEDGSTALSRALGIQLDKARDEWLQWHVLGSIVDLETP
jgi:hypothetical protein